MATGAELPPRRTRVAAASRFLGVRRELGTSLVSVAGLVGRPVRGRGGELVGRLADVVVRSEAGYPAVAGFVVRIGPRRAWVNARDVAGVEQGQLRLLSSRFDLQDVLRRPGEIGLLAPRDDDRRGLHHGDVEVTASAPNRWSAWAARASGSPLGLAAVLRRAPLTVALVVVLWVVGAATGSLVNGPSAELLAAVGVGPDALTQGRWWTPVTSAAWCADLGGYLTASVLLLVLVVPAERRLGVGRVGLLLFVVQDTFTL